MKATTIKPRALRRAAALLALALATLAAQLVSTPTAQAAPLPQFWTACFSEEGGSGANECDGPGGIAADPDTPGHVYVADASNNRINEFDAWGAFVKSWGWGVADGSLKFQTCGPEATPPSASCQAGIEGGGGGQFALPAGVAVDSAGDVYVVDRGGNARIQKFDPDGGFLRAWGGGVVSGGAAGTGDLTAGSDLVTSLTVTGKKFHLGQTITGAGIPAGTVIVQLGLGQIRLSKPATASGSGVALTVAEGAGNVLTNEQQTVTIQGAPTGGSFTLTTTSGQVRASFTTGSDLVQTNPTDFDFYDFGTLHVGADEETLRGALNRSANAQVAHPNADYWIGIEGGVQPLGWEMTALAWIVVRSNKTIGKGRTGTFFLPPAVVELIRQGKELGEADDIVFGRSNSKQDNGAVGLLTDNVIDRAQLYEHAMILALIPFKNETLYTPQGER